ncbi:hypothetical protein F5148DRAFT_1151872 [Russula earlei]|uniref:Uncharacterized protein n=1 Tax=Russula earlei TaxID=71964 RepID=A0ACC0TZ65_9AGAM|nr:hypothetical protein F5148DRAFT_1151872 [Russula earlei]
MSELSVKVKLDLSTQGEREPHEKLDTGTKRSSQASQRRGHQSLLVIPEKGGCVVKQGACVGHIGAVAAAVDTEAMAAARVRAVVREGGGVERHGHSNEVFTTAGGGSTCGCGGRGGMVQHGACISSISCGDIVVVGSDYSVGQHCGICFSEVAALRGGITARDRSVRAAWSGSRVVAGTRPGMVADKAEGVVAAAGCAGNTVDVTEEAEAEAAEDETGMETGDKEAAAG